jgi:hypothetical protein
MFAGAQLIQDDAIVNIRWAKGQLFFDIPAKETSFAGQFNEAMMELAGNFTFPDGSRHPIRLQQGGEAIDRTAEH